MNYSGNNLSRSLNPFLVANTVYIIIKINFADVKCMCSQNTIRFGAPLNRRLSCLCVCEFEGVAKRYTISISLAVSVCCVRRAVNAYMHSYVSWCAFFAASTQAFVVFIRASDRVCVCVGTLAHTNELCLY